MVDWLAYWSARSKCTGENKNGNYRIFTSWRWRYAGYRSAFWAWRGNDHDWHFRPGLGKTTIWKFNCILNQFPIVFITQNLILVGGGGHCKSCIDVIEQKEKYRIAGIVDLSEKLHQKILGYEIIATDNDLPRLVNEYENFLITLGQIKSPEKRIRIFQALKVSGDRAFVDAGPGLCTLSWLREYQLSMARNAR